MKECWAEGDLRAYLDGELAADEQERLSSHLETCASCAAAYAGLAERAGRVSNWMAALPTPAPVEAPPVLPFPARRVAPWGVAALALAAALAIGFVMLPKRNGRPPVVTPAPTVTAAVLPEAPLPPENVVPRRAVRHAAARPKVMRADFLRLDNEPIETGTIERVSAENGDVQADLIVGPDGRVRAIRLVSQ